MHLGQEETWRGLEQNKLVNESNTTWQKLFEKYRLDGIELNPGSRDRDYNSALGKLCNEDSHINMLQQTAMDIGKHQKLLIETNNNIYEKYIKNGRDYYDSIILSAYESLTGKQLDANKYASPWLSENVTEKILDYTRDFIDN